MCACYVRIRSTDALRALFQVIGVTAAVGINLSVVQFEYHSAYTFQEIAVVRHHEQGGTAACEKTFQPFRHPHVEVVGRFVQYQQVGVRQQYIRQRHTLELSARELSDGLVKIRDVQFRQDLLGPQFKIPCLSTLHLLDEFVQTGMTGRLEALFVATNQAVHLTCLAETGIDDAHFRVVGRGLAQVAYP